MCPNASDGCFYGTDQKSSMNRHKLNCKFAPGSSGLEAAAGGGGSSLL